jgi:hypothetical protein
LLFVRASLPLLASIESKEDAIGELEEGLGVRELAGCPRSRTPVCGKAITPLPGFAAKRFVLLYLGCGI